MKGGRGLFCEPWRRHYASHSDLRKCDRRLGANSIMIRTTFHLGFPGENFFGQKFCFRMFVSPRWVALVGVFEHMVACTNNAGDARRRAEQRVTTAEKNFFSDM